MKIESLTSGLRGEDSSEVLFIDTQYLSECPPSGLK
jgi:hypothetical protein